MIECRQADHLQDDAGCAAGAERSMLLNGPAPARVHALKGGAAGVGKIRMEVKSQQPAFVMIFHTKCLSIAWP